MTATHSWPPPTSRQLQWLHRHTQWLGASIINQCWTPSRRLNSWMFNSEGRAKEGSVCDTHISHGRRQTHKQSRQVCKWSVLQHKMQTDRNTAALIELWFDQLPLVCFHLLCVSVCVCVCVQVVHQRGGCCQAMRSSWLTTSPSARLPENESSTSSGRYRNTRDAVFCQNQWRL